MAHGILENDTMFSVKQRPWHGLGTVVQQAPSIKEAIKLAGLDWQVELKPLQTTDESPLAITTHKAVIRTDNNSVLGIVGNQYKPLQNTEAFDFFEPIIESGNATLETAGSLLNGKRIFILANTNAKADVVKDDTVESFILLSNGHDGYCSVRVGFTPIRVVCNNTLTAAHESDLSRLIRVKHSSSVVENLQLIQGIMDTVNNEFHSTIEQYKELSKKQINQHDLKKYVKQVFSVQKLENIITEYEEKQQIENFRSKLMERVEEYFELEPAHTVWNAYNAVNSYLNHDRGRTLESRYNSTWFGDNKALDRKALKLAVNL